MRGATDLLLARVTTTFSFFCPRRTTHIARCARAHPIQQCCLCVCGFVCVRYVMCGRARDHHTVLIIITRTPQTQYSPLSIDILTQRKRTPLWEYGKKYVQRAAASSSRFAFYVCPFRFPCPHKIGRRSYTSSRPQPPHLGSSITHTKPASANRRESAPAHISMVSCISTKATRIVA